MKRCIALFAVLLLVSMMPADRASARVLHVSLKPLEGVPAAQQFRTISLAAADVAPGDRVVVHGGEYRESVVVKTSGTGDRPITFEAATGERVVVTGADILTDWKREDPKEQIFSTPWDHGFIGWNRTHTHPGDDYHLLIGRCEQVFADHYLLRQVLERKQLARGTFFVDEAARRLYVQTANNADLSSRRERIEASVRQELWRSDGAFVQVRGMHFRYAANMAQHGAVVIRGNGCVLEDCVIECTNSIGVGVENARGVVLRRCTMQYNGQMGFGASRAHNLLVTHCTIRGNNVKGWDRGWEAGGDKLALCRGVVIEQSRFLDNRGVGIWFDIGNEQSTIRNCLVAGNENAGIFYEISYSLHAHDNVIMGNGFDADAGAWGASSGIALSSSPDCVIERNLLVGNKEGFDYREQMRTTPRIDAGKGDGGVAVWNHDQVVRNNVLAYNRDAQCWGWFDCRDERAWPAAMHKDAAQAKGRPEQDVAGNYVARSDKGQPINLSLEKLKLDHHDNLYFAAAGQGLFNWGPKWTNHKEYRTLAAVQGELAMERGSESAEPGFADYARGDLRVPADSPAIRLKAYPQGEVPGVILGTLPQAQ